ncbi:MAG: hypothetical protein EXS47_00715 [Candidatus Zambryskibacteria bacterium]|nr:hypothetical protein [Candidatus Zambryskibacteria bacterium]
MTRSTTISIDEFYHVYNRGTEKRKIFNTRYDYERFIALLYLCNSTEPIRIRSKYLNEMLDTKRGKKLVDIGAYCLMPNHFHLLLYECVEDGTSLFMQKLTTAYTMYFNKKNDRVGSLFQGTFKAEHLDDDEYLKYIFAYIHLNPVKLIEPKWREDGIKNRTGAKNFLKNYSYSSYSEFTGVDRKEKVILSPTAFPKYFEKVDDFQKMINFWIEFKNEYLLPEKEI